MCAQLMLWSGVQWVYGVDTTGFMPIAHVYGYFFFTFYVA